MYNFNGLPTQITVIDITLRSGQFSYIKNCKESTKITRRF